MKVFLSVLATTVVYTMADVACESHPQPVADIISDSSQIESLCVVPDIYPCKPPNDDYPAIIKEFSQEELDSIAKKKWVKISVNTFSPDSCQFRFEYRIRGSSEFSKESDSQESQEYSCKATANGNESLNISYESYFTWHGSYSHQLRMNRKFKDGKIDGMTKVYRGDATLAQTAFYKNGLKEGQEKTYSKDGSLKRVRYFSDGKLNGSVIEYDDRGNKLKEVLYKDGKIERSMRYGNYSDWTSPFMGMSCVAAHMPLFGCLSDCYEQIKKKCRCAKKYEGKPFVAEQTLYQNGEKQGVETLFYEPCDWNGNHIGLNKKSKEHPYEKGVLNGSVKEYYSNGKLKSSVTYKNGDAVTEKKCFSKNGKVQKTGTENMECN